MITKIPERAMRFPCDCWRIATVVILACALTMVVAPGRGNATTPEDFYFFGLAGGRAPWTDANAVLFYADGACTCLAVSDRSTGDYVFRDELMLDPADVEAFYGLLMAANFFTLDSLYQGEEIVDGDFVGLLLNGEGQFNHVFLVNYPLEGIDDAMRYLDGLLPEDCKLLYNSILVSE